MKSLRIGFLCLCVFINAFIAKADHLPDEMLATGKPEIKLAGIDLTKTKLDDVVRLYGAATREKKAPNNPSWTGYIWELPGAKIELSVDNGPAGPQIHDVYVEGSTNKKVGSTGRGLKFGDDIAAIKRLYGSEFKTQTLNRNSSGQRMEFSGVTASTQRVTLQWRSEEFTLNVGLDEAGKVAALWLILPECYPGPCE